MDNNIQLQRSVLQGVASLLYNNAALRKLQSLINNMKKGETDAMTKAEKEDMLNDIKKGIKEVRLSQQGEMQLKSARDFLDEIRN